MEKIKNLKKIKCGEVIFNPHLKHYTTYNVGGEALALVYPKTIEQLITLLKYLQKNKIKYKILGNGSNLIFKNKQYNLVIIRLNHLDNLEIKGNKVVVGAGYSLIALCLKVAKKNLTGLEFASGIPGTVGGAVFMNAGAYKSDMGYIVQSVEVLNKNLEIETLTNQQLNFHYRTSFLKEHPEYICLSVTLKLRRGKKEAIMEVIKDRKQRRKESQPLEYPSAGSVFRNPEGMFAGKMIEDLGYKGKMIGGAKVSEKHANFIINYDKATGEDIINLINEIKSKVKEEYGVELKVEQEIVK